MLSLQKYNYMLIEDRRDKIIDNIKEIEKCHDWCSFDLNVTVSDINLASLSYEDIFNGGQFCENLAKLSLDYWRDYDFYKSFVFKSQFQHKDYIEGLKQLGFECNDGQWQSIRKPDEKTVVANIFAHCLLAKINSEMILHKSICTYRSFKIGYGLRKCSCGASINDEKKEKEDEERQINKEEEMQNIDNEKKQQKKIESVHVEGTQTSSVDSGITVDMGNGTNDESIPKEMRPAPNKWMCGWCKARNEYSFVNCVVCERLRQGGKWYCGQCNGVNNRDDKCCSKCQKEKNIGITPGSRKDDRMCSKCGSLKNDGSEECRKCLQPTTIITPPLNDDQWECSKYNSNNQYLRVKTLSRDNGGDVDVIGAEGKDGLWLCCEQTISQDTEYCPKCQLWRHNPQERGQECKRLHRGNVELVWLCHVCHIVNPINKKACSGKYCGGTRYPRVQCPHCKKISKGKSESCKSCYNKLI